MSISIENSRNVNTGHVDTGGGTFHIGNNYYKSLEYKDITKSIFRLEKLLKVAESDEERLEYSKDLNDERDKLDSLKRDVMQLAETFERISLDTEPLTLAKKHFEEGNFKEARAILNAEQIDKNLELIEIAEKTEQISHNSKVQNFIILREQIANEFLVLAQLTAINFNLPNRLEQTKFYFEKSILANKNSENLFALAHFLQENKIFFEEAIQYYQELLTIYKNLTIDNPKYIPYFALTLFNLTTLYCEKNDTNNAEKNFNYVLAIFKNLVINQPRYLPLIAKAHTNLGHYYQNNYQFPEAELEYQEALKIRKNLDEKYPNKYLKDIAESLHNLGNLHLNHDTTLLQADKELKESLKIRENLRESYSSEQQYLLVLAKNHNDLGRLLYSRADLKAAEKEFDKSLQIHRQILKIRPEVQFPDLAYSLSNLANLHSEPTISKYEEAEKEYMEALQIIKNILHKNSDIYKPILAEIYGNFATLYCITNTVKAEKGFEEALKIYKELAIKNARIFNPHIARICSNLCLYYLKLKPNRELSTLYAKEAIMFSKPIKKFTSKVDKYHELALWVLNQWV